jgi:tRNA pseudouridine38-40 synthase
MRRIVLDLEYHGKGFVGWQRQGPDRSVQGTIEAAIADLTGHIVSVQSAGRTDRGVHALAMAAHVDVETRLAPREVMPALNHRLPHDVAVRRVRNVDPRFHARFDASGKLYRYTLLRSRARSPMLGDRTHQVPRELDVAAMRKAATALVGTHDFASFQTNPDQQAASDEDLPETTADRIGPAAVAYGSTEPPPWRKPRPKGTVRAITRLELIEQNEFLLVEVEGNGFLRGMVRALAGTLVEIGLGKQTPAWVKGLIDAKDRREAGPNLPPHALTLVRVDYPPAPFTGQDSTDDLALV